MKVDEGSQIDDAAHYHEVVGSPAQESDDMMLIDQGGTPRAGNDADSRIDGPGILNMTSSPRVALMLVHKKLFLVSHYTVCFLYYCVKL